MSLWMHIGSETKDKCDIHGSPILQNFNGIRWCEKCLRERQTYDWQPKEQSNESTG